MILISRLVHKVQELKFTLYTIKRPVYTYRLPSTLFVLKPSQFVVCAQYKLTSLELKKAKVMVAKQCFNDNLDKTVCLQTCVSSILSSVLIN